MKATEKLIGTLGRNIADSIATERGGPETIPAQRPVSTTINRHTGLDRVKAFQIPLDRVRPDPDQPRREFGEDDLDRLARSLRDRGQIQPIRVRVDPANPLGWLIVAGERRWRAANRAGLDRINAVVAPEGLTPREILAEQLTENCLREDLSPVDRAGAFRAMMAAEGWTQTQLAEYLHLSQSSVSLAISLLTLPPELREDVDSGALTAREGARIARLADPDEQHEAAARYKEARSSQTGTARPGQPNPARRNFTVRYDVPGGRVSVMLSDPNSDDAQVAAALSAALKKVRGRQGGKGAA